MVGGAVGDFDSDHGAAMAAATDFRAVFSALNEHSGRPHLPIDPVPGRPSLHLALPLVVARLHHRANQRGPAEGPILGFLSEGR